MVGLRSQHFEGQTDGMEEENGEEGKGVVGVWVGVMEVRDMYL